MKKLLLCLLLVLSYNIYAENKLFEIDSKNKQKLKEYLEKKSENLEHIKKWANIQMCIKNNKNESICNAVKNSIQFLYIFSRKQYDDTKENDFITLNSARNGMCNEFYILTNDDKKFMSKSIFNDKDLFNLYKELC